MKTLEERGKAFQEGLKVLMAEHGIGLQPNITLIDTHNVPEVPEENNEVAA